MATAKSKVKPKKSLKKPEIVDPARRKAARGPGGLWVGSGNPNGSKPHKKLQRARELISKMTDGGRDIIAALVEILTDKDAHPSARVRAAEAMGDRLWGKAPQPHEMRLMLQQLPDADIIRMMSEVVNANQIQDQGLPEIGPGVCGAQLAQESKAE